jgi:peptidoglycan hydrolase-like protein with peptidoglycan-binding domain
MRLSLSLLFSLTLAFLPFLAFADPADDLLNARVLDPAAIKTLQDQIASLQRMLADLAAARAGAPAPAATSTPLSITRALALGMRGDDVAALQTFLKGLGYFNYPSITGYFGSITAAALKKFQSANSLEAIGAVGPRTRALIARLTQASQPSFTLPPTSTATSTATATPQATSSVPYVSHGGGGGGGGNTTPSDTAAPALSAGSPSGTLAFGTTGTTLSLTTNEGATCKYSTSSGAAFGSMTAYTTTGGTSHSSSITGLTNGGSYIYYVKCQDGSANANATDYTISFTVAADTTSPTVSVTAPSNNATVAGTLVTVSANASDDVSVAGVQFKLDTNTLIGAEDTSSPYSLTWNSTGASDGSHAIIAVARDGAGNFATSSTITVTVDNTAPSQSSVSSGTPTDTTATITWPPTRSATSRVVYGTTSSYGSASTSASLVNFSLDRPNGPHIRRDVPLRSCLE